MNNNQILAWFSETLNRLFQKSPVYFKIWNIILIAVAVVPQIPAALAILHINVPLVLAPALAKMISTAATGAFLMSKLTVNNATVVSNTTDSTGVTTSITTAKTSLPFTANALPASNTPIY